MRVVIAGGTGFLGRPLSDALARDGHDIVLLSRRQGVTSGSAALVQWSPDGTTGDWASAVDGAGAVVNLAGESIAARRWTPAQKQKILESRVMATRSLAGAIRRSTTLTAGHAPVFVSGSAVGLYGPLGDEVATETHAAGSDFLAQVCVAWEAEALRAADTGARVVLIRTGLVLERDGGALPKMLPPFWFGAGGPVGSGRQYWPWIHRADWVDMVRWAIGTSAASGPLNASAPNPVTNAEFARALGRALHRPAFMPAPAFAMKLALGEMADALLLSGQRAVPARAQELGFRFQHTRLDDALRAIFATKTRKHETSA